MTEEQLKALLQQEMKSLQESLAAFKKAEDIDREIKVVSDKVDEMGFSELKAEVEELKQAGETIGLELQKMREKVDTEKEKSIYAMLKENAEKLEKLETDKAGGVKIIKSVTASNFTDDTNAFRVPGVAEIQRGFPYLRDLFTVVNLGNNTHGSVAYMEQEAVTSNASNVAEGGSSSTQSEISWVEKTLGSKRIHDSIKVSKNQIKDVDFVMGEVNRLLDRNMRLKENSQLLSGLGTGNEIKGITNYAQAFATAGISVQAPNLNDLARKTALQIRTNSLDKFVPNYHVASPIDIDTLRDEKDELNQYVFRSWAEGAPVRLGGVTTVENSLVSSNTLLTGDFSMGTIYVWDGLVIEMGYIDDDFVRGYVTLSAYLRENLLVRDNEAEAFVWVPSISDAKNAITKAIG